MERWVSDEEPKAPQSPRQAPPSPDYVPGPEHPPSPDYVPGPKEPEQAPIEDQPLPPDASPAALSPGYVADSDLKKDPEEDPADYLSDGGDKEEEDSSGDDANDEDAEEAFEADDEEEHPALADSSAILVDDLTSMSAAIEALIVTVAAALPSSSPPTSLLSHWLSPLPQIPSSPLHVPSPPLPLPLPPTYTSPTYVEAPLGYRVARIRLRAASPSTHNPSKIPSPTLLLPSTTHRDDLLEADMLLQKRAHFTAPTGRFEVGESSSAAAARQAGHTLAHRVDYRFVDTVDASIRAVVSREMTIIGEDHRALLRAKVYVLTRKRRYFRSMAFSYGREAVIVRQAWSHSESRIQAMEAQIRALRRDVDLLQRQRISDDIK
ncbi:hypothetical protein Tco_1490902 [Tanacetum coccineum]